MCVVLWLNMHSLQKKKSYLHAKERTLLYVFHIQELLYDVHFWIGQYSSQDEYGTAAYKTVELDTLVSDLP